MRKLALAKMEEIWKYRNNINVTLPNLSLKFVN